MTSINSSQESTLQTGTLYVVATPIGHLADISARAIDLLKAVDYIAVEDTRHSAILCKQYQIQTPMMVYENHREQQQAFACLEKLKAGQNIALITDAGTPAIADPGYRLTQACHEAGVKVSPVPGASAMVAALSASGLPSDSFAFHGFLPSKSTARQAKLAALAQDQATLIFYEAPHRLLAMIDDCLVHLDQAQDRQVCVAHELTKHYEWVMTAPLPEMPQLLAKQTIKGEFVVVVQGAPKAAKVEFNEKDRLWLQAMQPHLPAKTLAKEAAKLMGLSKSVVYQWLLDQKGG